MHYKFNVLHHLQSVRAWAGANGARIDLNAERFQLEVKTPRRSLMLLPRFMVRLEHGGSAYTSTFTSACRFVGWLPYTIKRWPAASDKLLFKACCAERGLRTPTSWPEGPPEGADFIMKPRNGSWGKGIQGPFKRPPQVPGISPTTPELSDSAFCEQFIDGQPTKIWFWNAIPVAMDSVERPVIVADGLSSLAEIAARQRGNFDVAYSLEKNRSMLAWQGVSPESVPAAGASFILDFLYATPFDRSDGYVRDCLPHQALARRNELEHIGACLFDTIGADIRDHTLFTLDAVIDRQDRLWLLEMNSHTVVHPRSYPVMLDDLFFSGSEKPPAPCDGLRPGPCSGLE